MDRYEEALEKARAGKSLEEIFPELKESEDERIRKAIMEVLKRVSGATDVLENQGTTFKKAMIWLEKQKEQPAEWSEEDEEIIYSLRSFLIQTEQSERYGSIQITQIKKCLDWLKSLRPPQYCENCKLKRSVENWKPSKEQMYILNWVANILLNHDGIVEKEVAKKLQSLCNDLNKLM